MAQIRMYKELRLKQKAANERMRQLEKADIKSPAYQSIQAKLEVLGKQSKDNRGRRFSETGKATYNEMEVQMKILDEFLSQGTSKIRGAREYYDTVWESANENNKLSDIGITKEQWFEFWENMPNKKKDRMFGSAQIVNMLQAYVKKGDKLEEENKMSMSEIAEEIQSHTSLKAAYKSLGITQNDVRNVRKLK